ncbi:hypothetical protein D5S18_18680 [Nocardia panacis]|uniref:Holin n=1 Tax=Nocardia panacis TaxID=2340916 RepID=A0A3A4KK55_9NOCA|nr:hypothetical protein [Nocardia panacis]RJO74180.1 hypothetical protein D5S18_18680 [Nocardia panacis]
MTTRTPTPRVPEPALVRSTLVAVTGIVALIVGHAINVEWIDSAVTVYTMLSPIIAGLLIRAVVRPVKGANAATGGQ